MNEKSSALKHIEETYKLIPMSDITDKARELAVRWVEGYEPEGIFNLEQKHKLASDIMNYAAYHAKEFADWLADQTVIVREEKITLYQYDTGIDGIGNHTLDDIYLEFQEHLKRK